ncbi:MAG: uracil-DNA glycosylase family protein, partial [Tepidisphaeraceae bacterium]
MESGTKNRVRLWLRSERAFGLNSVPLARADVRMSPQPRVTPPVTTPRPATPPVRTMPIKAVPIATPPIGPFEAKVLPTDEKQRRLAALDENEVRGCTRCRLCEKRTNTVFGEGDVDAQVFFIGEGPGETEDLEGRPFVGRAG